MKALRSIGALALLVVGLGHAQAQAAPSAYVANNFSNSISVIDMATNQVTATIPVGNKPWGVAVTPDGTRVYASNAESNTVSVIDTATNTVIATIDVGVFPQDLAVTPDGAFVYGANRWSDSVFVIATGSNTVTATIAVSRWPIGVAITPDGLFAYVGNWSSRTVSVIATPINQVVATIPLDTSPFGIAVQPDGVLAWVATDSRPDNGLLIVDTLTGMLEAMIDDGRGHNHVAFTPDGTRAYVTGVGLNAQVSAFDTSTRSLIALIPTGTSARPWSVALTQDGTFAYVTNASASTVSVIDTATNTVIKTIDVGDFPLGIAIQPIANAPSRDSRGKTGKR